MKKFVSLVLVALMVLGLVSTAFAADEKLKIVYCINGTLGDKSFFDSGNEGMQWVNEQLGDKAEATILEFTYDDTTWKSQLENVFMGEEYDIIIVGTYDMLGMTVELTEEYPDQKVWFYDEQWDFEANPRENVLSLLFKQNEGSYIVGAMAAMASKTGHISFCGGMSNTVLLDFFAGYKQGAASINPEIVCEETWMNSFSDSSAGKDVATGSYSQGVDVVFACGGNAGLGVYDAALEFDGVYAIGVDGDHGAYFESIGETAKADKIITSMTKNLNQGFLDTAKKAVDGTLEYGQNYRLGLDGGYVGAAVTSATNATFSAEQLAQIEDIKAQIVSGAITVDTSF